MMHSPAHLLTAGGYIVISAVLLRSAWSVWRMSTFDRAFLFGPFLTERGTGIVWFTTGTVVYAAWRFGRRKE